MLTLWMMGAALWTGSGIFGLDQRQSGLPFGATRLITMLILLGPAIEGQRKRQERP
jgi:hypothetical protein